MEFDLGQVSILDCQLERSLGVADLDLRRRVAVVRIGRGSTARPVNAIA